MNFNIFGRGALIAFLSISSSIAFAENSVSLHGHLPLKHLSRATDLGPSSLDQKLELAVFLNPRDLPGLSKFLSRVYDPKDELFHHFLSPEEFTERFSPTQSDVDQLVSYLAGRGFEILEQHKNRMVIDVRAPSSLVQDAFQIEFHDYLSKDGNIARSPSSDPVVPETLGKSVKSIVGLHNFTYRKHHSHPAAIQPETNGVNSYMTPARIASVYNVAATGMDGTGEKIALFELDGYTTSDITAYASNFMLPSPQMQNILVDNATGVPSNGGGAGEVTLDIELALAVAPKSTILIYEGPLQGSISGLSPDKEVIDIYTRIANDNLAKTVSTSWGTSESETDSAMLAAENTIFLQMAAQGQSFFAAAGDSGAYDNSNYGDNTNLAVDDPASQPYATGVGGTNLTWNGPDYGSESSWHASASSGIFGMSNYQATNGGGGGISSHWPQPTYQNGFSSVSNRGSSSMRMVPDVSLDADPSTGYPIYYGHQWLLFGGTSCAAPLWAAYTALVNERKVASGGSRMGFMNPTLYSLASTSAYATSFHDIADNSTNLFYPATSSYDLTTGLGSFNGANLFNSLTNTAASAGAPSVPTNVSAQVLQ